ncbi:MAG: hypothetical protein ABUS56_14125 [Acidobacteriota bacterium]
MNNMLQGSLSNQVGVLLVLAIPVACIAWTVTHEAIFEEMREYCAARSRAPGFLLVRKFFYLFTCEYCLSHWVTFALVWLTGYRLLLDDWRGAVVGGFALVWIANHYMSLFGRVRLEMKLERLEVQHAEQHGHQPIAATSRRLSLPRR